MGMLDKWVESLDYQFHVSDSCVRGKSPWATCNQCVESCKEEAITLKNHLPVIQAEKCVECGNCMAFCPVQAVEGIFPKRTIVRNQLVAEAGMIPSRKELLVFHAKGITSILFSSEDLRKVWNHRIHDANTILQELGKSTFFIQTGYPPSEKNESVSRRELFSLWGKEGKSLVKQVTPAKWRFNHTNFDLSRYYSEHQFFDVVVEREKCTLCSACEALCPKECFRIGDDSFEVSPQACSDCQLCVDVCPEKAITIRPHVSKAVSKTLETYSNTCVVCKDSFKTLSKHDIKCPICAKRKAGYLNSKV
ncbi:4Fe-4S dicluster domain-containing protein [Neobacillus niacini]|uniref:4Fe-4S dicluster domain-containing protein n=1 Tax=Neobacillus niacini TaxID=86668 RepID=UPI0005EE8C35|nr:4Fe-4S dicluster domain-containing protein [Neobacillus niacini]